MKKRSLSNEEYILSNDATIIQSNISSSIECKNLQGIYQTIYRIAQEINERKQPIDTNKWFFEEKEFEKIKRSKNWKRLKEDS